MAALEAGYVGARAERDALARDLAESERALTDMTRTWRDQNKMFKSLIKVCGEILYPF